LTPCPRCGASTERGQLVCVECGNRLALKQEGRERRPLDSLPAIAVLLALVVIGAGACGLAAALAALLPADATLVATDSPPGMADLARHRACRRVPYRTIHFVRARPHALPFHDGAFDLAVSAGGLHQWPNPHAALVEVRRTLAAGGRYFVVDLRRDLNLAQWLLVRLVQSVVVPRDLRAIDEPSSSIGAAYAPHEAEWLAARAQLPDLRITRGPAWLAIEPSSSTA
jgi:SAM-dependent methyltransferase